MLFRSTDSGYISWGLTARARHCRLPAIATSLRQRGPVAESRSFRTLLRQVLHLRESPQRTAFAFALGVFIAFCPAYGFHMILVGLFTWLFRLNFVALLTGALINNPWTIVPILGGTYWRGAL